ncbi:MAG TPA: AAA family ATPase [Geminocystis sp. M7585_C2015_104]|nr:AAA family ATPase [Geminocystis sp. M7585_C2015_104]
MGAQGFEKIRKQGQSFVDKNHIIAKLIGEKVYYFLIKAKNI